MTHHDSGWRPKGALDTYRGFVVSDHTVGANEFNPGDREWDVDPTGHATDEVDVDEE
jgi:hypothetical protein